MKVNNEKYKIVVLVLLCTLVTLMIGAVLVLSNISEKVYEQFEYQVEMQFCLQDGMDYHAPCRLEMDTDGSVHWYFNANEGRMGE